MTPTGLITFWSILGIALAGHGVYFWRHPSHYDRMWRSGTPSFLRDYSSMPPGHVHHGLRRIIAGGEIIFGLLLLALAGGSALFNW